MDPSDIEVAIQITWSHGGDENIRSQALNFVNELRTNAAAWSPCFALFARTSPPAEDHARHFCLEVICNSIPQLDTDALEHVRAQLVSYVQQHFAGDTTPSDAAAIQNKLCQALTILFVRLYPTTWHSFFYDFLSLAKNGTNIPGTILYFRLLLSIHDEIGDVILFRDDGSKERNVSLKDLVRERDADKVALFWRDMLSQSDQVDLQVLQLCLRSISRWVSWSDISLVVNEVVLNALLQLAGQQGLDPSMETRLRVRDAAVEAFTEIASKKMRPSEKVELIQILKLDTVVSQLIASPGLSELQGTSKYDTDLAELVAKLVNNIVRDIVVVLDSTEADDNIKQTAHRILLTFLPFLLRFFSDEYDEVCSTVIDGLSEVLTFLRRISKNTPGFAEYTPILPTVLQAIVNKMKYDESVDWEDIQDSDEGEFEDLRRRLQSLQKQVFAIDEQMSIMGISELVQQTFRRVAESPQSVDWRDLDLALYELTSFGDFALKTPGYGSKGQQGLGHEQLSVMMIEMMTSSKCFLLPGFQCLPPTETGEYDHPAVQLRFCENCVKYTKFFEGNESWIPVALESFVRYAHSGTLKVRGQTWYHFLRFVKGLKKLLGSVSEQIIQAMADLLSIKATLSSDVPEESHSVSEASEYEDSLFNSQVFLFEAIGCLSSASTAPTDRKVAYIHEILSPIFADIDQNLSAAKNGEERSLLQVHHDIMAAGNFAHGFNEWKPGSKSVDAPPPEIADQFIRCGEVILLALQSLNNSKSIRQAARHSFSRLIGCSGKGLFPQLRQWVDCIVSPSSSKEEISYFIRLLAQIVFAFKTEISNFLGDNLSLLLERVFERMTEQALGTDDENELGELRREFLSFIMVCLNNNLGSAFILPQNQAIFEKTVSAIEEFARDPNELHTARLALSTITRMIATWAGPAAGEGKTNGMNTNATDNGQNTIPGFDTFAISRLSPLVWAIPASPGFKPGDAGGRLFLQEVSALQLELYKRTGVPYAQALKAQLLGMGVPEGDANLYLEKLNGDAKVFKEFVVGFLGGR
jgi:exportin-T